MTRSSPFRGLIVVLVAAGSLGFLSGTARATSIPAPLTIGDVVAGLHRTYPPLLAAEQERQAAVQDRLQAEGGFDATLRSRLARTATSAYPQTRLDAQVEQATTLGGLTWFGGYRLGLGDFATYDGKLETNQGGELRAGLSWPLLRNGPIDRRRATLLRAEQGLIVADGTFRQQHLETARTASWRYWDWVAAGMRLRQTRQILEVAERRTNDLEEARRIGQIPALEVLENQRAVLQRRAQVFAAERSLVQAGIELGLYVRDAAGAPVDVGSDRLLSFLPEASPPVPDENRARVTALANRPEVVRIEAQVQMARIEVDLNRNQTLPGLDLSLSGSQDLGAGSDRRTPAELEAGIGLEWPIQTRTLVGRLGISEAQLARLEAQQQFIRDRVHADVRDTWNALNLAKQRADISGKERELAAQLETAERERFRIGEGTLFMVNLREQATLEAGLREIDARADQLKQQAALEVAMGLLPGEPHSPAN
jgi:cobalt-zinc-cadmium efflux system outer membrane protein